MSANSGEALIDGRNPVALGRAPDLAARAGRLPPFADTHNVRGRPSEIATLVDELVERLARHGFQSNATNRRKTGSGVRRLTRGEEWLNVVVADASKPHRLHLPNQFEISVSGEAINGAPLHDVIAALPFTKLEIESLARDMPLTASIVERAHTWLPLLSLGEAPLAGHAAIFTIHHQTDFVLLLEKALELGVERSLVTVIDKEYRYRYSRRVDAHVRERLNVPVYPYSNLKAGISDHIRRIVAAGEPDGAAGWTPTIVVDDGGYVLPCLRKYFEPYLSFFKGLVEQTMSGIWKLEPYTIAPYSELRMPVFSVAESELKATVEAQGVAQAALTSLRRLLPQEKFDGRAAVIVGFGRIGQALAEILRRQNVEVHVVDIAPAMRVTARERGFNTRDNLVDLLGEVAPRYIFACARPDCVDASSLRAIRCDCALISVASRDEAFDKSELNDTFEVEPLGTLGTRYSRDQRSLLLIADGFPVNFHFAESMPNQQSDLVMASLLVGAISIARMSSPWRGNNPNQIQRDPQRRHAARRLPQRTTRVGSSNRMSVPPPVRVFECVAMHDARVHVYEDPRCRIDRALAFGVVLADARASRGLLDGQLRIFASEDPLDPAPLAPPGSLWVAHLYRWRGVTPAIAWELIKGDRARGIFGADQADVERWIERPDLLLRLIDIACETATNTGDHLSLRWLLANEALALEVLSGESVVLEHVSIHVSPDEEVALRNALVEGVGLLEVSRPTGIAVPGTWLQAGSARLHLNSRLSREEEVGFPGTAPNHICLAVVDLEAAVLGVNRAGFQVTWAGSLGSQAWFRLSSGTRIELQQRR